MKTYLVRIQLRRQDNYDSLHKAMEHVGFERTIRADDGRLFKLPHGEYLFNSRADVNNKNSVAQEAQKALDNIGDSNAVMLVTRAKAGRFVFRRLEPAS